MKKLARRSLVLFLFAALVVVLLWFQGLLFRHEPDVVAVPGPQPVDAARALGRVERVELARVQVHPGFVEASDEVAVAARVLASVLAVPVREGDPVSAGQELVVLDDRDARAQLAQVQAGREAAEAQALQAELAFQRAQRLLDSEALTTGEWESARAARDAAQAQEERAARAVDEASVALSWFRLSAPFAGRVLEREVEPGQLATPGRALVTVYREEQLRFSVAVPEERAAELVVGAEFALEFDRLPARTARLARVLPPADARTGTVTLHLELPPSTDLRPGLLGRLQLVVGRRTALVVPRTAVERVGQVERVQLVRDGRVVPVTVRTGKAQGDALEVLSGLEAGEEVLLP